MVSVQGYSTNSTNVAFKANAQNSETQNKTFETHAGLKTGAVYAGTSAVVTGATYGFTKKMYKAALEALKECGDEISDLTKMEVKHFDDLLKFSKKNLFIGIPVFVLASLGCGAFVDKKINAKHAELAQKAQEKDAKEVLAEDECAELTRDGNLYHRSNTGKKVGAALGAVAYSAFTLFQKYALKAPSGFGIVASVALGALGGLGLGAITDACSNKAAKKHADRQCQINA
ncbi:hypothetical protein IJ472_00390 [bacterium]|nr:hypothetical protein [bacterium]